MGPNFARFRSTGHRYRDKRETQKIQDGRRQPSWMWFLRPRCDRWLGFYTLWVQIFIGFALRATVTEITTRKKEQNPIWQLAAILDIRGPPKTIGFLTEVLWMYTSNFKTIGASVRELSSGNEKIVQPEMINRSTAKNNRLPYSAITNDPWKFQVDRTKRSWVIVRIAEKKKMLKLSFYSRRRSDGRESLNCLLKICAGFSH